MDGTEPPFFCWDGALFEILTGLELSGEVWIIRPTPHITSLLALGVELPVVPPVRDR